MKTLLLNPDTWDLMLDASSNIALAAEPYAIAQDVGSAIRLFLAELWYDTSQGIPYFEQILGKRPPLSLVKAYVEQAALRVPLVVAATCVIASFENREITGQVQITDSNGGVFTVGI